MNQDIINSKYFFYGSADYNEFQTVKSQYALYEPMSDRFVLTSKFADALQQVAILFSGKVNLQVCKLHTAENFKDGLLDNTCCTNWTLSNKGDVCFSRNVNNFVIKDIYSVEEIVAAEPALPNELIIDNIEFLMAAYHWSTYSETRQSIMFDEDDPFYVSELQLNGLVNLPIPITDSVAKMKEVYSIIFNETDFETAEEKVEALITGFKGVQ